MTLRDRLKHRAIDLGIPTDDIDHYTAIELLDAITAAQNRHNYPAAIYDTDPETGLRDK